MTRNGGFKFRVVAIAFVCVAAFGQAQRKPGTTGVNREPAGTPVLIKCDQDCLLIIDGGQAQSLSASDTKLIPLSSGQHLIEASDKDNTAKWSKVLSVSGPDQIVLLIDLQARVEQAAARKRYDEAQVKERAALKAQEEDYRQHPTWTDPATGLMWGRRSSIQDMDSDDADEYCRNSTLGGYSNWRVPTIQELQAIYDNTQNVNGWANDYHSTYHIKGGIHLTSPVTRSSSSVGETYYPQILNFQFGDIRFSPGLIDKAPRKGRTSVLCVRPSGE